MLFGNDFIDQMKGRKGERLIAKKLWWVRLFGRKGKVLRNIYVQKNDGTTTEIDLLFVTQKGMFVFESKNYSGWIYGNEGGSNWTAVFPNKQKFRFYNPIWQNKSHIKWLKQSLNANIPMFSFVVFSDRCSLKDITVTSPDVRVIQRADTYWAVRKVWNCQPDVLTKEGVDDLFMKIKPMTKVSRAVKKAHIENIKANYKN